MRNSGRVPFAVLEGTQAYPRDSESSHPPDKLFPLPLPELPPLSKKGRGRERSQKRLLESKLLSGLVAAINCLFFGANPARACFPKGTPGSAAQYRCLQSILLLLRDFLRGLSDARRKALAESVPDPRSFPGGEDSYHSFIRVDGPSGPGGISLAGGGRPFGVPCSLDAERVDLLESAGDLDPVIILKSSLHQILRRLRLPAHRSVLHVPHAPRSGPHINPQDDRRPVRLPFSLSSIPFLSIHFNINLITFTSTIRFMPGEMKVTGPQATRPASDPRLPT